jgi:hypothetical protein
MEEKEPNDLLQKLAKIDKKVAPSKNTKIMNYELKNKEFVNRLRETNSAFERFDPSQNGTANTFSNLTYHIVEHEQVRSLNTQGKNKFINRVKNKAR